VPQVAFNGVNPAAYGVPDVYMNIQPPPAAPLPGAVANLIGIVGSATWGPVNSPVTFGDFAGATAAFGPMQARKYDMLTAVALAVLQGANNFVAVRATDGTDTAATAIIQTNCLTLTAKYTGTRGNSISAVIASGTAPSTYKITLSLPGLPPETFDNIAGSGNALWVAMAAAINNGQSTTRGPSNLVTASAGAGTTVPTLGTTTLASGTDGASSITATTLIGSDSVPRSGMYALRNTGLALMVLADADASSSWATQLAFAKSELCEAIAVSPAGDTISNFTTTNTIDDPWISIIFGDWCYFLDAVNNLQRLVSPQGVKAGMKAVVGPHQTALNKAVQGVIGTQKSVLNQTYSTAELISLGAARGDLLMSPSPGGNYFSFRFGRNASSDPGKHQDPYTTMTNYLARSMSAAPGTGQFVGRLITPNEMREAASAIGSFLENEKQAGRISAYSVQVDARNNPSQQTQLGIQKATVVVTYQSVVEYFQIDFSGGQTVVVPQSTLPLAA
jgi:hypothetical protein